MTDSIFHGAAVALSLYASNPPDFYALRGSTSAGRSR